MTRSRIDDQERLRLARMPHHYTDALIDRTINAYTAMARGELKADRVDTVAPAGEVWDRNTTAAIHAALQRSLIGPAVLEYPCPTCGAQPGVYCVDVCRGYCGPRVHLALRTLVTHLSNLEWSR